MSTILTSVITAITTVLLATVIFVLVQIAVCKHLKPSSGEGEHQGTGDGPVYDKVYEGGRSATSDPTYMEITGRGGEDSIIILKENEAYTQVGRIT